VKIERLQELTEQAKKFRNERDKLQNALDEIDLAIANPTNSKATAVLEVTVLGGPGLSYQLPLAKIRSFVASDLDDAEADFDQAVADMLQEWRDGGGTLE
jgi:hypothetical protein